MASGCGSGMDGNKPTMPYQKVFHMDEHLTVLLGVFQKIWKYFSSSRHQGSARPVCLHFCPTDIIIILEQRSVYDAHHCPIYPVKHGTSHVQLGVWYKGNVGINTLKSKILELNSG